MNASLSNDKLGISDMSQQKRNQKSFGRALSNLSAREHALEQSSFEELPKD